MDNYVAVADAIQDVMRDRGLPIPEGFNQDLSLSKLGLDSLDWAVIAIKLEETLGEDPFADTTDYEMPNTVGDFARLYTAARNGPS